MVPLKRRKVSSGSTGNTGNTGSESKFPEVVLFLLERKMGTSRRAFLSQLGRKKGFKVEELFSESVTHVISENNSGDEVRAWLDSQVKGQTDAQLLDISWYTESMRAGRPVDVLDRHKLQEQQIKESNKKMLFSVPSYACQRRTTLDNHNTVLTDALSLLAENAELSDEDGRGVAFRRAAAVLKALPAPVTDTRQLRGLPCLGGHSLRVIKEILENGASSEVESTKQSERFRALKVLTGIFGVGVKTAERWIRDGILGLQQLKDSRPTLNRAQQAGLEHYDDLKQQVSKAEADAIGQIVEEAVASVLPGARVTLIGGFRRGKQTGHDVDFLITHPEDGREVGLMPKVVSWLESKGFLLYQKTTRNSYLESEDGPGRPSSNMDRFERCFSIFKLSKDEKWTKDSPEDEKGTEDSPEDEKRTEDSPEDEKQTEDSPEDEKGTEESPEDEKWTKDSPEDEKRTEDSPEDKKRTEDSPEDKKRTEDSPEDKKQTEDSPEDEKQTEDSPEDSSSPAAGSRVKDQQINPWRAVRVDLVVSPISQFAFALLGWTGSKLFERELRRWAGHEKAMSLSSHALYDNKQNRYLRATSEEEIFAHLGLEYIPPTERNA